MISLTKPLGFIQSRARAREKSPGERPFADPVSESSKSRVKLLVVGMPKAGTTTIDEALKSIGWTCAHWISGTDSIGELMYRGHFAHSDPLFYLGDFDALTQLDYCKPKERKNYWPQLDLALINTVVTRHPHVKLLLNYRDPASIADSILRWYDFGQRIAQSEITGLPKGYGKDRAELARWISGHYRATEQMFGHLPNFKRLDITAADARDQLSEFLGVEIKWWGVANKRSA